MVKKYGIFWLSTQRELYRDDSYYVLGTSFGLFETFEDAENKVKELVTEGHIITILPIYQKE